MKKKSLLILPVLLLALAACNKEEEEEVPADDTTTPTEPGDQGTGDGGDGGEKEPVVDTRITLTEGEVVLNEVDEGETPVTYANPSDGSLSIDKGVVGEDGSITYTVTGTAPTLSAEQAEDFWSGHAAEGDKFIIINVKFNEDEAVSWVSSAGDTRVRTVADYPDGSMDVIIRISGKDVSEDKLAGTATYTIGEVSADGSEVTGVDHIVDFTALFDTRITVATSEASLTDNNVNPATATYVNESDLAIASVKTDESGNVTYVLSGTAATMDANQAQVYWNNVATAGELYFVVTVSLEEGEEVSWISPAGQKSVKYDECDGAENIILRITGAQSYGCESATSVVFTIAESTQTVDAGSEPAGVTHTVDFSALLPVDDGGND